MAKAKSNKPDRDLLYVKMFFKSSPETVTDEEVEYFRTHPDDWF